MNPRHTFTRATLGAALLSAFVLAQPAHAGLLGAGSVGGVLGGGLGGSFGPRNLDVGGAAAGQARHESRLPRADRAAVGAADMAGETAAEKRQAMSDRAAITGAAAAQAGHERAAGARHQGASLAGGISGQAAAMAGASRSRAEGAAAQDTSADVGAAQQLSAQPRKTQTSTDGSVQASRGERSLRAEGSADASVQR